MRSLRNMQSILLVFLLSHHSATWAIPSAVSSARASSTVALPSHSQPASSSKAETVISAASVSQISSLSSVRLSSSAPLASSTSARPQSALPASSQAPIPNVFPSSDPKNPPSTAEGNLIPDFSPAWNTAYQKAKSKVAALSLDELVSITTGLQSTGFQGRCVGNIPPIEPVNGKGWPGLCLEDSPLGVRLADFVTAFPTGINTAATLIRQRGLFMGLEHSGKGVNVALGPMMNLGRVALGGRNFEGFGEDPFLAGEAAYETILGMQQGGVQACAKHFIDNEQEHARMTESVMAGVASVMCSYNLVNNTYACENDKTLNGILKTELGFQGYVMSDWGGTHSTLSAVAGLDMTMPGNVGPGPGSYFGGNLTAFVQNQTIPMDRVKDMATRVLAGWFFCIKILLHTPPLITLKSGALPLKKPRSILLAGSDAGPARVAGPNEFRDQGGNDGILAMGGGSGTANFTYLISPYEAIQRRARDDRTSVSWIFDDFNLPRAGNMAIGRSAALVFVNSDSSEGSDRANMSAWHGGDNLILSVAAQNNNTIVITHSVGPLIVEPWIEHPNITAVLWAGAPGQEAGNSITDILYGDWNPSGKLPYTIAKQLADYPAQIVGGGTAGQVLPVPYNEGLLIGYRGFDAKNITPRFEFGFGLSYTKFTYSNLHISKVADTDNAQRSLVDNWDAGKVNPTTVGSSTALWLHRPAFKVSFDIQNTGSVAGGEIPQLYLQMPASAGEPPSILKGFTDVHLSPGQKQTVSITLSRYALSIWDVVGQGWRKPEGSIGVVIGASSRTRDSMDQSSEMYP
ncbi:glycoside hydrolase superfamily [Infundibulicybe gibba]|nr:glycoside hydrolase superfamily [Infundibulicybe gibba]